MKKYTTPLLLGALAYIFTYLCWSFYKKVDNAISDYENVLSRNIWLEKKNLELESDLHFERKMKEIYKM